MASGLKGWHLLMNYRRGIIIGLLSVLFFSASIMLSINTYNQQQIKSFSVSQQPDESSETYENEFEAIIPVKSDNSTTPKETKGSKDVNENNNSLLWMKVSAIGTLLSSIATPWIFGHTRINRKSWISWRPNVPSAVISAIL